MKMKVYTRSSLNTLRPEYLQRVDSNKWVLMIEDPHDFDYIVRVLDEHEVNLVESVFQHFAEPMKKLIGE